MNDLKNIGIRQFLAWRGILPKYERNGYGMYLSPLREERTPSFKVDYVQNLWYDFGLREGGTLLTLMMRLERCDSREAVRRLQNGEKRDAGSVSLSPGVGERPAAGGPLPVLRPATVPALRILSDASLRHPVIHTFFDNDEAGRKATADLIRLCPRSELIDQSSFYSGHKDVNDYLTARIKGRTQKPSTQKNAPETKAVQALRNNLQALKAETAEIEPPRRKGVKI